MKVRTLLGVAAALLLSVACASQTPLAPKALSSVTSDNRAEQIVFSGQIPPGTFESTGPTTETDVGFWVWCEHRMADNSYAGECDGSLNIGDLSQGVSGTVMMDPDMDQHIISVSSKDGSLACTLSDEDPTADEPGAPGPTANTDQGTTDVPHTAGPTNTVNISCTAPAGVSGTFTGAVVKTTERLSS